MREKDYIVNSEDKIVVSLLRANSERYENYNGVWEEVLNKCSKKTSCTVMNLIMNSQELRLPELDIPCDAVYKGVAKCDQHDEFNRDTGVKIAGNKAEMKYHIAMAKKYKKLVAIIEKVYEELYVLEWEHVNEANKINNELKQFVVKP